jgi:hypothetical protein
MTSSFEWHCTDTTGIAAISKLVCLNSQSSSFKSGCQDDTVQTGCGTQPSYLMFVADITR